MEGLVFAMLDDDQKKKKSKVLLKDKEFDFSFAFGDLVVSVLMHSTKEAI